MPQLVWQCIYCGEVFDDFAKATEHEEDCRVHYEAALARCREEDES